MSFTQLILVGNVGKDDPELRFTPTGLAVCNFSLAVNDKRKGETFTTWYKVAVFGQAAEFANQYVEKGKQIMVVADRIEAKPYLNKQGEPAASLEIVASQIRLLGSRNEQPADTGAETEPF